MTDLELIESQERVISKQGREIKKLEREKTALQEEFFNFKKENKLKLLEIREQIKKQSRMIKELRIQSKAGTRQIKEMSLHQLQKEESAFSKIQTKDRENELIKLENEELINKITQNNVTILEKNNEISNLNTKVKEFEIELEDIKQNKLNELQHKLGVKEDLLLKQNEAVNQLTLDIKKYEVEIAELEYKLSNEQTKLREITEQQKKHEKQEDIIIHLRKVNIANEEKINTLREQLNNANKRTNDLIQKLKSMQTDFAKLSQKIPYFRIKGLE